jgi:hypothetical protein
LKTLLQDHGPAKRCASSSDEIGWRVPTVTEWLYTRIDNLTAGRPATIQRYRTYVSRVVDLMLGSLPIAAATALPPSVLIDTASGPTSAKIQRISRWG